MNQSSGDTLTTNAPGVPGAIRTRKEGALGWLIFDNPAQRNAITRDMWFQSQAALEDFSNDPAIRAVIMTGAGDKAFVAGAEILPLQGTSGWGEQARRNFAATDGVREKFARFAKPLIAMINGHCIGAGLGIALRADVRFAADSASFSVPSARLGLNFGLDNTRLLVTCVGPAHAKDLLMSGRRVASAEALRIGLVNQVVAAADLEAATRDYALLLAANAPLSMQSSKFAVNELTRDAAERDLAEAERQCWACFDSDDFAEGRRAFAEKRNPNFLGR